MDRKCSGYRERLSGMYVDFMLQPGDMVFVNNRLLMHARTDYEDWP